MCLHIDIYVNVFFEIEFYIYHLEELLIQPKNRLFKEKIIKIHSVYVHNREKAFHNQMGKITKHEDFSI